MLTLFFILASVSLIVFLISIYFIFKTLSVEGVKLEPRKKEEIYHMPEAQMREIKDYVTNAVIVELYHTYDL